METDLSGEFGASGDTTTTVVFAAVVLARFVLPLFILKYPLPAILACLVLDGVDQSIFQWFGHDPPGYQSYDKAMDVFYLAVAYLSMLRNWTSRPAFAVGWFLFFYRLVGVVAFEATHVRLLLLVFPNTFEYYFIAYEVIRTRWSVVSRAQKFWTVLAAGIWIVVKLPQEYWIHVAGMDLTDTLSDHPWTWGVLLALIAGSLAGVTWLVRTHLGPPGPRWHVSAAPIPPQIDTGATRAYWIAKYAAIRSWGTVEKVVLVGLMAVIYGSVLPGYSGDPVDLFVGVGTVVLANAVFTLVMARKVWTVETATAAIIVRLGFNIVFVHVADFVLNGGRDDLNSIDTLFFLSLISLVTTLHDRYRPVHSTRLREAEETPAAHDGETAVPGAPAAR